MADRIGPWAISGPAQYIGAAALTDETWADNTRNRLEGDAKRLDALLARHGHTQVGGTNLFRLYETLDADVVQSKLARKYVWSRAFPYSKSWLRLGLPGTSIEWDHLTQALEH